MDGGRNTPKWRSRCVGTAVLLEIVWKPEKDRCFGSVKQNSSKDSLDQREGKEKKGEGKRDREKDRKREREREIKREKR